MTLDAFMREWRSSQPFVTAHTSGSTGKPKEIALPKADMEASARATNAYFGISASSTLAIPLSLDYIAGKMMAVRALVAGCRLEVMEPSNTFRYSGCADLLSVVPSQVPNLLANADAWSGGTGAVIVGGAPLDMDMQARLSAAGYRAFCSYGMTETCSHVALQKVTGGREPMRAMPGVRFAQDARGCLVIDAPAFSWKRLVTNDVVELASDTSFFWIGRADNVINSGGIKIQAEALEAELAALIGRPLMVRAMADAKWGQAVELVVEAGPQEMARIRLASQKLADKRQIPKKITLVDALPRTSNGKIKRQ